MYHIMIHIGAIYTAMTASFCLYNHEQIMKLDYMQLNSPPSMGGGIGGVEKLLS